MRVAGIFLTLIFSVLLIWSIAADVLADYELDKSIGSYWELSVKASTLDAKAQYLDQFVKAVDDAHLSGNNALFLKTPDNSFEQNVAVLKTLQNRMNEIKGMDVTSFAYQQAIQQITAQEQGEATKLLGVIAGVWYLQHHPLLWEWINLIKYLIVIAGGLVGLILAIAGD